MLNHKGGTSNSLFMCFIQTLRVLLDSPSEESRLQYIIQQKPRFNNYHKILIELLTSTISFYSRLCPRGIKKYLEMSIVYVTR